MSDTEEIIARAIRDTHGTPADIAQALTQAGCGRWKVKPLVWSHEEEGGLRGGDEWSVETALGEYEVIEFDDGTYHQFLNGRPFGTGGTSLLEAAKAACEADHLARVMRELEVAPAPAEPTQPVPDALMETVRALLLRLGECSHADHAGNCQSHFVDPSVSCPVSLVQAAISAPLKTEAEVRADERDRLLCLALGSEEDDYYARDGYVAEWIRSQTQVEE